MSGACHRRGASLSGQARRAASANSNAACRGPRAARATCGSIRRCAVARFNELGAHPSPTEGEQRQGISKNAFARLALPASPSLPAVPPRDPSPAPDGCPSAQVPRPKWPLSGDPRSAGAVDKCNSRGKGASPARSCKVFPSTRLWISRTPAFVQATLTHRRAQLRQVGHVGPTRVAASSATAFRDERQHLSLQPLAARAHVRVPERRQRILLLPPAIGTHNARHYSRNPFIPPCPP